MSGEVVDLIDALRDGRMSLEEALIEMKKMYLQ